MIGAGAQVLDSAIVESLAIVAPGAVVTPKTVVPAKQLWAGSPAKVKFSSDILNPFVWFSLMLIRSFSVSPKINALFCFFHENK
jgi:hypothetical protein